LWYTGYDGSDKGLRMLGYATSSDGIHWIRHPRNPLYKEHWVEDMMVVKHDSKYWMFAEGKDDSARLLRAYELALSRPLTSDEIENATAFLNTAREKLRASGTANDKIDTEAWQAMARVILRLNEFVYID